MLFFRNIYFIQELRHRSFPHSHECSFETFEMDLKMCYNNFMGCQLKLASHCLPSFLCSRKLCVVCQWRVPMMWVSIQQAQLSANFRFFLLFCFYFCGELISISVWRKFFARKTRIFQTNTRSSAMAFRGLNFNKSRIIIIICWLYPWCIAY